MPNEKKCELIEDKDQPGVHYTGIALRGSDEIERFAVYCVKEVRCPYGIQERRELWNSPDSSFMRDDTPDFQLCPIHGLLDLLKGKEDVLSK